MSLLGVLDTDTNGGDTIDVRVTPTFTRSSAGLWDAIVEQIAPRDPAGSALTGPSWPGQPVLPQRGMFDIVVP